MPTPSPKKIIKMVPTNDPTKCQYISKDTKLSMATKYWTADIAEAGHFPQAAAAKAVEQLRKISARTNYTLIDVPPQP